MNYILSHKFYPNSRWREEATKFYDLFWHTIWRDIFQFWFWRSIFLPNFRGARKQNYLFHKCHTVFFIFTKWIKFQKFFKLIWQCGICSLNSLFAELKVVKLWIFHHIVLNLQCAEAELKLHFRRIPAMKKNMKFGLEKSKYRFVTNSWLLCKM